MSLKEKIDQDMKTALRAKDQPRLGTIRMLRAAIQRREIDERLTLDDSQIMAVTEKLIKQSREAAEQFAKGNRRNANSNGSLSLMRIDGINNLPRNLTRP